jgi:hypothetical protein
MPQEQQQTLYDEIFNLADQLHMRVKVFEMSSQTLPDPLSRQLYLESAYTYTPRQEKLLKKLRSKLDKYNKQAVARRY